MYTLESLEKIPKHMRHGAHEYIMRGREVGDFLTAVFRNSLTGFFQRADAKNQAAVAQWADFLYNDCPSRAQGSREKVRAWQEAGGLAGLEPEYADHIGELSDDR